MSSQTYRLSIEVISESAKNQLSNLKKALQDLEKGATETEKDLTKLSKETSKAGAESDKAKNKQKEFAKALNDTEKNASGLSGKISSLRGAFGALAGVAGTLATTFGIAAIIETQREFDVLNSQLITATGSTEKASEAFASLQEFASKTPYGLAQSVEGFAKLKNLGLDPSIESLTSFGNTASAMGKDLNQMIEAVADASTGEFERLKEFGIKAKSQGNQVSLTFQGVTKTIGKNAKEIQQYLLDIGNVNFAGAMEERAKTLDGRISALVDSWDMFKLSLSQGGIGEIIGQGVDIATLALDGLTEKLQDPATVERFQSVIKMLSAAFGELKTAVESIGDFLAPISDFIANNSELMIALSSGLMAGATAYYVITTAMGVFATVSTAVATAGGLAAMATTALGAAVAFLTSPITLAVAAIAALVAIGVYLYRNWDDIKAKASEVWNSVKETVSNAWESVKSSTLAKWEEIKQTASTTFEEVKNQIKEKFESIKQVFLSSPLGQIFATHFSVISTVAKSVFSAVQTVVRTAFGIIKGIVTGDVTAVKNAFSRGFNELKTIAKGAVDKVWGELKSLGGKLLQAGRDAVQGFINGFTEKMNAAYEKAREMASKVISTVKSALDIHSPSREMKKLGKHTADGMAVGIEQNTPKAVKAAQKMADDIKKTVADSVANLKREIALFGNDSPIDALKYDISIGKYKGADTKELEALTAQKYTLERNKVVLDEIDGIKEKIALVGKNELETLKYQLDHADKYKGISDDIKKSYLERTEALNEAIKAQERLNKVEAATADIAKNKHILANWQDKHAGLKYDLGKDGYDASQIEQIVQAEVVKEQVGKLQQLFSDISNKQVFATPNITANLANKGGGFDFAGQMLGQSFDIAKKFEEQNALLKAAREQGLIEEEAYLKQSEALTQAHVEAKAVLMQTATQSVLGGITGIMKNVYGEQSKHYKAAFAMEKAYAVATILMKQKEAIAKAWASAPFPANLGAVASTLASTGALAAAVNAIRPIGQAHDGIMSVPKSGTWNLEKGERVLPKHTAKALDDKLNSMGSGQTVIVNVTVNSDGTASVDSQAQMGKQMGEAIKVAVQQEIIRHTRQGGLLYGR